MGHARADARLREDARELVALRLEAERAQEDAQVAPLDGAGAFAVEQLERFADFGLLVGGEFGAPGEGARALYVDFDVLRKGV